MIWVWLSIIPSEFLAIQLTFTSYLLNNSVQNLRRLAFYSGIGVSSKFEWSISSLFTEYVLALILHLILGQQSKDKATIDILHDGLSTDMFLLLQSTAPSPSINQGSMLIKIINKGCIVSSYYLERTFLSPLCHFTRIELSLIDRKSLISQSNSRTLYLNITYVKATTSSWRLP